MPIFKIRKYKEAKIIIKLRGNLNMGYIENEV